ncbi:uncharacterized protein BO97DRAFT_408429 [Aspergillus homomorphus CBS 101889]|uniref:Uncharacterized protein n=1 Tax=Aspergillus homomorphus (strain CBS 101889) TaxID=1450537 RepID=A0A395HKK5_ASPHC|nr:hypothetical protein BO97DRAFT_408429 [Aspergillus homomorphus CBS 101889]RAL08357.1 hypothetical protein BO97DRAFT_408429 [Aspergillus homomorphus CBS 101889]
MARFTPVSAASKLESLPVEIIQQIFLHCLEINLPRASLRLANALSDPVLYTWMIRLAFSSTNASADRDFFTQDFLPWPLDFFALSPHQRRDLQSHLLFCRWCTLPLIRQCQRDYILHTIRRKCRPGVDFHFSPEDEATLLNFGEHYDEYFSKSSSSSSSNNSSSDNQDKPDLTLHGYPIPGSDSSPKDRKPHKITIHLQDGAITIRPPGEIYAFNLTSFPTPTISSPNTFRLPACGTAGPRGTLLARVPEKLLRPPWTPAKFEFLQLLAKDAYIDRTPSHTRTRRVLRQTIRDRDPATFQRLLRMSVRVPWYDFPVPWPVGGNLFYAALKYAPPPCGEDDDVFVKTLYDERWRDIPPDDAQLMFYLSERLCEPPSRQRAREEASRRSLG